MRARPDIEQHPAMVPAPGHMFRRGIFGYRRALVDDAMTRMQLRAEQLEAQVGELRESLQESQHEASEVRHDLTRARAELRYWNDRASYVDSEVAKARQRAVELEQAARERAESIEADAQERSLQLVDRVCSEANAMLQHAREEAREMFLRFETDVDLSQQRLERLERVRSDVAKAMQGALTQFEQAVRELDSVAPARRLVEELEEPIRRSAPVLGTAKMLQAAQQFDDAIAEAAQNVMSTPILPREDEPAETTTTRRTPPRSTVTIGARVEDVTTDSEHSMESLQRRVHDADEAFASLLLQP